MDILSLICILISVESGGNDSAVGDNGRALGCLQLHKIYIEDVNRIYGTTYVHEDALNREKAIEITRLYLEYWGGENPTVAKLALLHNMGPKGPSKKNTLTAQRYLAKVNQELNRRNNEGKTK